MEIIKLVRTLLVCLVFISYSAIADKVPSSGKPFQALQDQIDVLVEQLQNIELPPGVDVTAFMLHSNNTEVGYFIGIDGGAYNVASANGYIINISRMYGTIPGGDQFLFTTSDCSGTAYGYSIGLALPGNIFYGVMPNSGDTKALYYSPKDDVVLSRNIKSQYVLAWPPINDPDTGEPIYECEDLSLRDYEANLLSVNIMPFDEVITGFSSSIFNSDYALDLPLTIEKR